MPGLPYIKFIYILSLLGPPGGPSFSRRRLIKKIQFFFSPKLLDKINKKILCFRLEFSNIKGAYRQETSSVDGGSSETTRNITYNFDEYSFLIPQHKKKINRQFLE